MSEEELDLTRREFMQIGTVGMASLSGTSLQVSPPENPDNPQEKYAFQGAAHLIGPADARPAPGSGFFDNKQYYAYVYEDEVGNRSLFTDADSSWRTLNAAQQVVVTSVDDLPDPVGGVHPLEDNTCYVFNGVVTSTAGLELGAATPIVGRHGSVDGFICTGGGPAITGTNAGFFAKDLYVHAPAGVLFDLTGDVSTEMLVESCAFSDAAGIAPMSSLGTIDGFRVPSFKGCNFEDFNAGLTFDGSPDKIFISQSPLRGVTTTGVSILTFASTLDVDIVDLVDNYVKGVQSDTIVLDVQSGGEPTGILQYRGTTHDPSVTTSNILNGVSLRDVGVRVSDSYPLRDTDPGGSTDFNGTSETVTGSGAGPVEIAVSSTESNLEKFDSPSNAHLRYVGKSELKTLVTVTASVSGANTEFEVGVAVNGLPSLDRSVIRGFTPNSTAPETVTTTVKVELQTNDIVTGTLENVGGTTDLDIESFALTV